MTLQVLTSPSLTHSPLKHNNKPRLIVNIIPTKTHHNYRYLHPHPLLLRHKQCVQSTPAGSHAATPRKFSCHALLPSRLVLSSFVSFLGIFHISYPWLSLCSFLYAVVACTPLLSVYVYSLSPQIDVDCPENGQGRVRQTTDRLSGICMACTWEAQRGGLLHECSKEGNHRKYSKHKML